MPPAHRGFAAVSWVSLGLAYTSSVNVQSVVTTREKATRSFFAMISGVMDMGRFRNDPLSWAHPNETVAEMNERKRTEVEARIVSESRVN